MRRALCVLGKQLSYLLGKSSEDRRIQHSPINYVRTPMPITANNAEKAGFDP